MDVRILGVLPEALGTARPELDPGEDNETDGLAPITSLETSPEFICLRVLSTYTAGQTSMSTFK